MKLIPLLGSVSNVEHALLSYALTTALRLKPEFEFVTVNDVLPLSTTIACGFPNPDHSEHFMQYRLLDNPDLCLSGTAGKCQLVNYFIFEFRNGNSRQD
jgi:hypothetical protein